MVSSSHEAMHRIFQEDPGVFARTSRRLGLPFPVALAADPDGGVRAVACLTAWPHLDTAAQDALLADPHGTVRVRARLLLHRQHPMPRAVFEAQEIQEAQDIRRQALETCRLERRLVEHLARHGTPDERRSLAGNPRLDPDLVALLAEDRTWPPCP